MSTVVTQRRSARPSILPLLPRRPQAEGASLRTLVCHLMLPLLNAAMPWWLRAAMDSLFSAVVMGTLGPQHPLMTWCAGPVSIPCTVRRGKGNP